MQLRWTKHPFIWIKENIWALQLFSGAHIQLGTCVYAYVNLWVQRALLTLLSRYFWSSYAVIVHLWSGGRIIEKVKLRLLGHPKKVTKSGTALTRPLSWGSANEGQKMCMPFSSRSRSRPLGVRASRLMSKWMCFCVSLPVKLYCNSVKKLISQKCWHRLKAQRLVITLAISLCPEEFSH